MGFKRLTALIGGMALALAVGLGVTAEAQAASNKGKPAKVSKTSKAAPKKAVVAKKSPPARKKVTVASNKRSKTTTAQRATSGNRATARAKAPVVRASAPARLSMAQQMGLHGSDDPLQLDSSVALVLDQQTQEVLFSKNEKAVLPIASLTKLMTGLVVADAHLDMNEVITITQDDVDTYKGSRSRLAVGTQLTRGELMLLALMSSENRAAHALGRTFPGGMDMFVTLMNARATQLGMMDSRFVEPTGLMSTNRSSARDLAKLVMAAYEQPLLRELSTSPNHQVDLGQRVLQYNNSNRLIRNPEWEIGLQKTGYISEAGRCLVMQASVAGRQLVMVFLDARNASARVGDAERVRRWVEQRPSTHAPQAATPVAPTRHQM